MDGDTRPVVTAEYIKLVDDTPRLVGRQACGAPTAAPDEAFFPRIAAALSPGRSILILVDQGNIRVGQGRFMMRSAVSFVDGLAPADRIAMVAIPQGRPCRLHHRAREGARRAARDRRTRATFKGRFHISLSEAIATVEHSD